MMYYTNNPPLDEERYTSDLEHERENRRSIGECFYCGQPILAADDGYYGDEYIETMDGLIHYEECWEKYGREMKKEAT